MIDTLVPIALFVSLAFVVVAAGFLAYYAAGRRLTRQGRASLTS